MSWKLFQSKADLPGFGTKDNCGQSPYCGDCLVGHAGCVEFLKLGKTFRTAML